MPSEVENEEQYDVVINHEEQYSLWLAGRPMPSGWQATGVSGTRQACLDHIDGTWTDMRPRTLREQMQANAHSSINP